MGLILSIGCINAQSELPKLSTGVGDDGPWYYVRVLGSGDDRENRYWTVDKRETANFMEDKYRIFGEHALATSFEAVERQLFRFEDAGAGTYAIKNKFTGLYLDHQLWSTKGNKGVSILADAPNTDWIITEQVERPNLKYYRIVPTNPESEVYKYAHQGNSGFEWSLVFEEEQWGLGPNSSFYFIEYSDPGLLCPEELSGLDFGYVMKDSAPFVMKTIHVMGYPTLISDIVVECDETNAFFSAAKATGWDDRQGGYIEVYYEPTAVGDHTITVTISAAIAEGPVSMEVVVTGKTRTEAPVNFKASPSVANTAADTWYSIYNTLRACYYLRDVGIGKPVESYPGFAAQENTPEQLWKFVTVSGKDGEYILVNQAGHQLDFEGVYDEEGVLTGGRFVAVATSTNTFGFTFRPSDGYRIIHWNQYVNGDGVPEKVYLSKTVGDDGYSISPLVTNVPLTSELTVFDIHEYGKGEFIDSKYPILSTATNPIWYYIQFYRAIRRTNSEGPRYPDIAVASQGLELALTQEEIDVEKANTDFYWRFEGDIWNNLKIISYDGNEFNTVDNNSPILKAPGEGVPFKFITYGRYGDWQISCLDVAKYGYLNDASNGNNWDTGGYRVGGWEINDAGNRIVFTKVEDYVHTQAGSNIDAPINEIDGTVIGYVYYTLQGIQLAGEPKTEGLYIQKTIYADRKAKAKTIYIKK